MQDLVVTAHDGIRLAVRDHGGSGPDVLLLHGAQRTLEDWAPLLGHLAGVRAVAMDLRLHGRSEVTAPAWNDFVADVDSVVTSLGLRDPLVIGHSFGGMIAMADALAHPDRTGVVNVDGFDFRQRELFDEVDPAEVDRFLGDFDRQRAMFVAPDSGDDAWLAQQHELMQQTDSTWKVPAEVASATRARTFVRDDDGGWKRRPPNHFFDILDPPDPSGREESRAGSYHPSDPSADLLHLLREAGVPTVFVLCRPPGEGGMFAAARSGLERHVRTIASSNPNVRFETVDATHGVIFEDPAFVAGVARSLL